MQGSPFFFTCVINIKHSPIRRSGNATEAAPIPVYMSKALPSGMPSTEKRTFVKEVQWDEHLLTASQFSDERELPAQSGGLALHKPVEEQSSSLDPFREYPSLHVK